MAASLEPPVARTAPGSTSTNLIRRAQLGEKSAISSLFARHLSGLQRWAHGRLPRWARHLGDTADIVQESLFAVFGRLSTFERRREGAFRAYLRQAVLNRIRDRCRQGARMPVEVDLDSAQPAREPSPLEAAIGVEATERYRAGLSRLTPAEREAVVARIELGYSYAQIATIERKGTPDAARMMVNRAVRKLAREMVDGASRRDA